MESLLVVAGVALIALGLADLFFAVLHYDGSGFATPKLYRGIWVLVRATSMRLPSRSRAFAFSLAGPLMIPATITLWLGLEILGFALLYTIGMYRGEFSLDAGLQPGFWQALYLSGVSISTLGFGDVTAVEPLYQALTFLEGLIGFSILTLSISYILGVYGVLGDLRAMALKLLDPEQGDDAKALLRRYLGSGHQAELGGHFRRLHDNIVDHYEGMRRYPVVYYFRTQTVRSMPHVFRVVSDAAAAVRWALPQQYPASSDPRLQDLIEDLAFITKDLLEYFVGIQQRTSNPPADYDEFLEALKDPDEVNNRPLTEFLELEAWLHSLTGVQLEDPVRRHKRYQDWLQFSEASNAFVSATSSDLRYEFGRI